MILAISPRSVTDKLQRVLNAAARLFSGTPKYDRVDCQISHADLHWLDVADRLVTGHFAYGKLRLLDRLPIGQFAY